MPTVNGSSQCAEEKNVTVRCIYRVNINGFGQIASRMLGKEKIFKKIPAFEVSIIKSVEKSTFLL